MYFSIHNVRTHAEIFPKARYARGFWQRFRGLMFRSAITEDEALVFEKAPAIHMFFMRFAIDVLFLTADKKVCKIVQEVRPWQMASCPHAWYTVECKANSVREKKITVGDQLEFF